jgi:uncharacterized protein YebE (UPF0316 family)
MVMNIENVSVYLPKALLSILLLASTWLENMDWSIKIVAGLVGLAIGILTGIRIYHDIRIRISQHKERELRNKMLEEELRKMWEKK